MTGLFSFLAFSKAESDQVCQAISTRSLCSAFTELKGVSKRRARRGTMAIAHTFLLDIAKSNFKNCSFGQPQGQLTRKIPCGGTILPTLPSISLFPRIGDGIEPY